MLDEVPEDADHFLTSLYVHNAFAVQDLEIPIAKDGERRHLLLTGPNGSGKSSILAALYRELQSHPSGPSKVLANYEPQLDQLRKTMARAQGDQRVQLERQFADVVKQKQALLDRQSLVEVRCPQSSIAPDKTLLSLFEAKRSLQLVRPTGPIRLAEKSFLRVPAQSASSMLLQFLVNLRTEQAYAREDGDDGAADRIGQRFKDFESRLGQILDDEHARLHFDRASFDFSIELGDGRRVDFSRLPDGISSILFMWASMMIPANAIRRAGVSDPPGWALIDEPELHLHARLQEMVLPFLIEMFPNVQFIVATHSPAVLASISDATIFDLGSRQAIDSAELQGIRYGTILTEHFGIETDFDLETTRKLRRLKVLSDAEPAPGTEDFEELRTLAQQLAGLPHLLVAQVSKKLDVA